MSPDEMRTFLFWAVCVPLSGAIAVGAAATLAYGPRWTHYVFAGYAAWTASGFWTQALVVRPEPTAARRTPACGRARRWAHAALWTAAAVMLALGDGRWYFASPLIADALLAVVVGAVHDLRCDA